MECPVCKTINTGQDQKNCSVCQSDLEIFSLLENIERRTKRQKRTILYLLVMLVLFCFASAAYYLYFLNQDKSSEIAALETIRKQEAEIRNLNQEKQLLTASILELRNENDSLSKKLGEVEDQLKVTKATPQTREIFHVVKRGESLQRIALKYYGNSDEYRRIMQDNNIKNPNSITINQRLRIVNPLNE